MVWVMVRLWQQRLRCASDDPSVVARLPRRHQHNPVPNPDPDLTLILTLSLTLTLTLTLPLSARPRVTGVAVCCGVLRVAGTVRVRLDTYSNPNPA